MGTRPRLPDDAPLVVRLRYFVYSTPVEMVVYTMILLSVGLLAVEVSQQDLARRYRMLFEISEAAFTTFFVVEYVTKLALAENRWLFVRTNIIDLLAILPFLRFFRLLRGLRILRLLRLIRLVRLGNMVARRLSMLEGGRNLREVLIILVVFLATVLGGSIGVLLFERDVEGSGFQTLGDGLWWSIVTLTTVGYGDKYPLTTAGKILGGFIMLTGLSFYGLVAGLGSTYIITRLKKGSEWMVSTFSEHTVVLGVNDKLDRIVNILVASGRRVVIVTSSIDRIAQYPENLVAVIEGDFIDADVLEKARVAQAANAVILADTEGRSREDADARSVLATLAVEKARPAIHTVVECLLPDTAYHLENAGVDEIIRSGDLAAEMLAFSTDHAGYSANLGALMRFVHKNRILTAPLPDRFAGKKLAEATATLALERKILLSVRRDDEDSLAPGLQLRAGDEMIYVEIV